MATTTLGPDGLLVEVRDESDGDNRAPPRTFKVAQDAYGIFVEDVQSGHHVVLEIFDGQLSALVFDRDQEEPVVNHKFTLPPAEDQHGAP